MELDELNQIMGYIKTYADDEFQYFSMEVKRHCENASNLGETIEMLLSHRETDRQFDREPRFDREPLYDFLLAYVSILISDWKNTFDYAELAEFEFKCRGQRWNRAICNWLLGLLRYEGGTPKQAQNNIKTAIQLMTVMKGDEYQKGIFNDEYEMMIDIIKQSFSETVNKVNLDQELFETNRPIIEMLSKIILWINIPEEFHHLEEQRRFILNLTIDDQTREGLDILFQNFNSILSKPRDNSERALALVLFAYCNNFGAEKPQRITSYLSQAIDLFEAQSDDYNKILSSCYLSTFRYMVENNPEIRPSHLVKARDALSDLLKLGGVIIFAEEIRVMKDQLASWITQLASKDDLTQDKLVKDQTLQDHTKFQERSTSTLPYQELDENPRAEQPSMALSTTETDTPRLHDFSVRPVSSLLSGGPLRVNRSLSSFLGSKEISTSMGSGSTSISLTIPVDLKALKDLNVKSVPMSESLYEKLKLYNEQAKSRVDGTETGPIEDADVTKTPAAPRLIIPVYPIYSRVTAGPDGEPTLDESGSELAGGVNDNYMVKLEDRDYRAYSVKENDNRININSYRKYGWCKVIGDSMNNSTPIPIDSGDFILFFKNNDPEACDDKIVIASQPEFEAQPPRLMVKRLVIIHKNLKRGNIESTIKKYYLHSESSRKIYKDIEMIDKNQIIGEVIAIAKPI